MRRERTARIGMCVLLFATVALTGCRLAEHGRRAAIDAFASFVLDSLSRTPLHEKAPAVARAAVPPAAVRVAEALPAPNPTPDPDPLPLPDPQPRITINLAPSAAVAVCQIRRIAIADIARAKVEARMAAAEFRGQHEVRVHRIIVLAPQNDDDAIPATL